MDGRILRYSSAIALLSTIGLARGVQAQLSNRLEDVRVDGQMGYALPVGALNDYENPGPSLGVDLAYPVSGGIDVDVDGEVDLLSGSSEHRAPDMRLWRYQAGLQADLLRPPGGSWSLRSVAGLGATSFRSNEFIVDYQAQKFDKTYFTGSAGLELAFGTHSPFSGYITGIASWSPVKKKDTQVLEALDPGVVNTFSSAVSVPISLGFKANL